MAKEEKNTQTQVLILVLLGYGLVVNCSNTTRHPGDVLILVLLGYGLVAVFKKDDDGVKQLS